MKKTLLSLALVASLLIPASAANVATAESSNTSAKTEYVKKDGKKRDKNSDQKEGKKGDKDKGFKGKKGKKDGKKCEKKCDNKQCNANQSKCAATAKGAKVQTKRCNPDSCVFAALNLTETQQLQVKALNEARETSRKELRSAARQARIERDSVDRTDRAVKGKELNKKYLSDLREILTADQYVQFLENNYVNTASMRDAQKPGKQGKHGREIRQPREHKMQGVNLERAQKAQINVEKTSK